MKKLTIRLWRQNRMWQWELWSRNTYPGGIPDFIVVEHGSNSDFANAVSNTQREYLRYLSANPQLQED